MEILKGKTSDKNDLIDFADYVFSKSTRPHDFTTLLPKLYGENEDTMQYHYMIRENDKIMANVCSYPTTMLAGENEIKVAGIGTVSAHPRSKGKGYMKALMNRACEDMKTQGTTFSLLAGQRQRYEYFGYYPAGTLLTFMINRSNIRHAYGKTASGAITVKKAVEGDVAQIRALHESSALYTPREDFLKISGTWGYETIVIIRDGKNVGYMLRKGTDIAELMLKDWNDFKDLCLDVFSKDEEVQIAAAPWESQKIATISPICECSNSSSDGLFRVFDYAKLFKALLVVKSTYAVLEETALTLDIDGEIFTLAASDNGEMGIAIAVAKIDEKPDFIFTAREAGEFLLSPMGMLYAPDVMSKLPRGWFPLPLYLPHADQV